VDHVVAVPSSSTRSQPGLTKTMLASTSGSPELMSADRNAATSDSPVARR
jgi:hypothetical protein